MIIIPGKTHCRHCNKIISKTDEYVVCPAYIMNKFDPLFHFNDTIYHLSCFHSLSECNDLLELRKYVEEKRKDNHRVCKACRQELTNPDEVVFVPNFRNTGIEKWSLSQIHKSCIPYWPPAKEILIEAEKLYCMDGWNSIGMKLFLEELKESLGDNR